MVGPEGNSVWIISFGPIERARNGVEIEECLMEDRNVVKGDGFNVESGFEDSGPDSQPGVDADQELLPALYQELRQMAVAKMARERPQTLQATALVHEAWMKLDGQRFGNRAHFFAAASEAMRRILVDQARRRKRLKRGGEFERSDYVESRISSPLKDDRLLLVHEALDELERQDARKAQIVKLRYFAGLENAEIGAMLGVNEKTVRRHWEVAKVMLFQLIRKS